MTFKDLESAKKFNERAKGEYVIEVHAGGALVKLPEYFDAVRIGAVEIADAPYGPCIPIWIRGLDSLKLLFYLITWMQQLQP